VRPAEAGLLVVCRGNVYRSPAAEHLLRDGLGDSGVQVTSAGLRAPVGQPVAPAVAALLAGRGIDVGRARARQLDRDAIRRAGVVLVMTRSQRAAVVGLDPAAVRRTFLLRQAAATLRHACSPLAGATPAERLAALPGFLAGHRSPTTDEDPEIVDPSARPDLLDTVFAQIEEAVAVLVGALDGRHAAAAGGRVSR
jgi:protein-tyrosine phosphatase